MEYISGGETELQTISIVGMPGAGKTSLAMQLFKESSVGQFDRKAWCTVSQSYEKTDLLVTILNQIIPFESHTGEKDNQEELAVKLCKSLRRRRYLVVIDDLWHASLWNYLIRYFPNDKTQSRILITTRDLNVAAETKSKIHELPALTEEESWELMQKKIPPESLPKNLVAIAKQVTKRCKGLPLSIVIIGGVLRNAQKNEEMWNHIAKHLTSTILSDPQEDHKISVTRLVRLWVGEGLVKGGITSEECVEDVGRRYVDDLIARSLVIPIKEKTEGGVKYLQLHDLIRDFCLEKTEEENFFNVLGDRGTFDLSICPRRINIHHGMDKHLPFIALNSVRTIISFDKGHSGHSEIGWIMKSEHMMLVNVLDAIELDGSSVHRLVHLRYLAIWKVQLCNPVLLLSSICTMWNLQTLILDFGNCEVEVPDLIFDLVKLRHIQLLPSALFMCHDRKRLEDSSILLENLKSLSKPHLHYGDSNWLSKFPELQKLSCIFSNCRGDIRFPELNLCNQLTSVKVEYVAEGNERRRDKLHLPESLIKLSLSGFLLDSDDISEIGETLPHLEVLKLHESIENWNMNGLGFLKLKVLKITGRDFHEWDAPLDDPFPSLEQLWLQSCDSLEGGIPLSFGDIPGLRLISINKCHPSVYDSAREIEKIQAEAQNQELKLNMDSSEFEAQNQELKLNMDSSEFEVDFTTSHYCKS